MFTQWRNALLLMLSLCLGFSGVAYAQGVESADRVRKVGEVAEIDLADSSFSLETRSGELLQVVISESTHFRSPDDVIQSIEDLEVGMPALVIGELFESGILQASLIAARPPGEHPQRSRMAGEVGWVDLESQTFELIEQDGDLATIQVDRRTRFRSHDGSLQGLDDLEEGMKAVVVAVEGEGAGLLARWVAAAAPEDIPDGLRRWSGEIAEIYPDRGTFTLETSEGETVNFQTGEGTRFMGRGMEVEDLDDVTQGMLAAVAALEGEEGAWEARFVLVWEEGEFFDRPEIDLRAVGWIVGLGEASFTLQRRNGEELVLQVDGETTYRSRGGVVEGFEELEVGMPAVIGAVELEGGGHLARWVAVGKPGDGEGPWDDSGLQPEPPLGLPQEAG
jgi:hypothetical protein